MNKACLFIVGLLASAFLNGCLTVNAHQEPPPPAPAAAPATPQEDPRSIPQLREENRDLRARLAKPEKDHQAWRTAVESRKRQLKDAERERDLVKKERDESKKRLKKSNKD
jgi:hypothetical protein